MVHLFNVALEHHQAGRLEDARRIYLELIESEPGHSAALANLGVLFLQRSRPGSDDFEAGVGFLKKCISCNERQPFAHNNLANALAAAGDFALSDKHYLAAIEYAPGYLDAYINRSLLLKQFRGSVSAKNWLTQFNNLFIEDAAYWMCLGALLLDAQQYLEALQAFDKAIELSPGLADAWYNRGNALRLLSRFAESLTAYRKALSLDPNIAEAWVNMGVIEQNLKSFGEAINCYDAALRLRPESLNANYNRALVLENTGQFPEAVAGFERTLLLAPNYPYLVGRVHHAKMLVCDWTDYSTRLHEVKQAALSGVRVSVPFPLLAMFDDAQLQLWCAQTYVQDQCPMMQNDWVPGPFSGNRRIRVGYFSADFRTHAVGFLTAGLFEAHDRQNFDVYAISLGVSPEGDLYRDRIAKGVEHFIDASTMTDAEVVDVARALALDIAVDLGGHTMDARTKVFAQRVARWQVNYLGYPGSMGAPYMDVIFADDTVVPEECDAVYSERVIRLPNTFQINDRQRKIGQIKPREFYGLPEQGLVLASFNISYKLNPPIFDVWCRLLEASPKSALWLLGESEVQMENLQKEAAARGVDPARLVFADRMAYADHLARYRHVDLVLDTLPFNGGTSTSDALWGGVPVLTCMGNTFAARMSASLLKAVGLPELITNSMAEYERLAMCLVADPDRLKSMKDAIEVSRNSCALFGTVEKTRDIEKAYKALLEAL